MTATTTRQATHQATRQATRQGLKPAPLPTGPGTIGWLGPTLAILLIGIAVLLGQDAWTRLNGGSSTWLGTAAAGLNGVTAAPWIAAIGAVITLIGLWLVIKTFARRTRNALALRGGSGAHLSTGDVARLITGAATSVDGVLEAKTSTTRRKATVAITTTGTPGTEAAVQQAAEASLAALVEAPRITVRTTTATASHHSTGETS